ncbi:MAG: BrnA antitoxin family protein [Blastocatellia bacterium]|nr:BrnA antitoxin family protein [Blastocatellia bacterium]
MRKKKQIDPIPEEFASYEEAAEFWDAHDTTDYPDAFRTVEVQSELRKRHTEIEIDTDVVKALRAQARRKGVTPGHLASDILRQRLTSQK